MSVTGSLSSDEEDEVSDLSDNDQLPKQAKRRLAKIPIQARLRQSCQGRNRAKEGPSTEVHGRVYLSEYSLSASEYSKSAASGKSTVPAYSLMVCNKVPARSVSYKWLLQPYYWIPASRSPSCHYGKPNL